MSPSLIEQLSSLLVNKGAVTIATFQQNTLLIQRSLTNQFSVCGQ